MSVNRSATVNLFPARARGMRVLLVAPFALIVSGCLAKTAVDLVTLPVRVVSAGVDAVTTSQAEADEARGRRLREADEQRGRDTRQLEQCARETERRGRESERCTRLRERLALEPREPEQD